ncbi:MAG: hypothetical protein ABIQ70_08850 [Dokdonella sp.]
MGILRLAKDHRSAQLQAACRRALELNILSYRGIRELIAALPRSSPPKLRALAHDNVRGPDYFGDGHAH